MLCVKEQCKSQPPGLFAVVEEDELAAAIDSCLKDLCVVSQHGGPVCGFFIEMNSKSVPDSGILYLLPAGNR